MLKNIKGIICFKARGNRLTAFISAIRESDIMCFKQSCVHEEFRGRVYRKDYKNVLELARKMNIELEEEKNIGKIFTVRRYRRRYGIIAGFIIALLFVVLISNTIAVIEINGTETITDKQVIALLDEMGISRGKFIQGIDFKKCEQLLRIKLDRAAWVNLRNVGARIVVDIDEESEQHPPVTPLNITNNVVAARDGRIKKVTVHRGMLNCLVGEGVKKGDVIISGIYTDPKDNFIKSYAMGEVIGEFKEQMIFTQLFSDIKKEYSGKEISKKTLSFFGFEFPLYFGRVKLDSFDLSESEAPFLLFGKKLPISLIHREYKPFEYMEIAYSEEEAEKLVQQKTAVYEKNFLTDCSIISREIQKNLCEDRLEYIVEYKLEAEIGINSEIFIKK